VLRNTNKGKRKRTIGENTLLNGERRVSFTQPGKDCLGEVNVRRKKAVGMSNEGQRGGKKRQIKRRGGKIK